MAALFFLRGLISCRRAKPSRHPNSDHPVSAPGRLFSERRSLLWVALCTIFGLTWLAYAPGLSGGFLFDDFANLPALGAYGRIDDWPTFWRYLTSGTADPTGRPLSLLSFLVDARDWPADPFPFKRTNLLLHLLNGILLFALLRQLGRQTGRPEHQASIAAALGTALWLLHPLLVSTTLYIVQREAMLPATFLLLGISGYVRGRTLVAQGRISGALLAAGSVTLGTTFAFLSKANGALLPLLVWVLELTLLARQPLPEGRPTRVFAWTRNLVVVLPSLLLLAYLARLGWNGFVHGTPPHRPWTLGERLLTQCRILAEYLAMLWLPRPYTHGLFNDGIIVSTGLFRPWTTFASLLGLVGLLASGIAMRRRWPAWSAAILFFFVAHLMESSVVALELYYEHRNYLPALLMFWPLALWLADNTRHGGDAAQQRRLRRYKHVLMAALPLLLALLTWMRADLWGNLEDQAAMWALHNPDSPRAQAYAAQLDLARGDPGTAIARLEPMLERRHDDIQAALNLVGAKCSTGTLTRADLQRAATALRTTIHFERMGYRWFERSIASIKDPPCPQLRSETIQGLLAAADENPHAMQVRGRRQDLLNLRAHLMLVENDPGQALALFNAALDEDPRPGASLAQAALLGRSGHPAAGLAHLDHFEESMWAPPDTPLGDMARAHQWLLEKQGYWDQETRRLRQTLEKDAAAMPAVGEAPSP